MSDKSVAGRIKKSCSSKS